MTKYVPTIGLEIHAELKTKTKMFCDCPNNPEEKHPNTNVCPICLGHPGTLPTINQEAIEAMMKIGFAVGGEINEHFKFDRKNYFYPDLPKGYQISQYDQPLVRGGMLDISVRLGKSKAVSLNRVHLEEDAGKLVHSTSFADQRGLNVDHAENKNSLRSQFKSAESASLVDFNRGGLPLMELVTEPDMYSVKEAIAFAKELQLILRYLGVSDADLEKGQMRFDVNISVSKSQILNPKSQLGVKVEVKNLNSFAALEEAINYEIERQIKILDSGTSIKQETRGWDDVKKVTTSQRTKEEAHDYRYFPEPDLPPLDTSILRDAGVDLEKLKLEVPELPNEKRSRFKKEFQLSDEQVNILVEDREEAEYFEEAVSELEADTRGSSGSRSGSTRIQLLFNYLNSDLKGLMKERELNFADLRITPENFTDLIEMISKREISSRTAKDLLVKMLDSGVDPVTIVESEGLKQVSAEEELKIVVEKVIAENSKAVADYRKGKGPAMQFLIGKAMAELKGRGNPEILRVLFEGKLK